MGEHSFKSGKWKVEADGKTLKTTNGDEQYTKEFGSEDGAIRGFEQQKKIIKESNLA